MTATPWRGVLVATALPFVSTAAGELEPDLAAYGESIAWLAAQGLHGVAPNGSLGEYQTLTNRERDAVVQTAVEHAPEGFVVMPGVGAYSGRESRRHAEVARDLGAAAVMALPPNAYRGDDRAVLEHYELVAGAGLPVVAYNNPIDTKIDLTPALLAHLHREGLVVAVKEFTGDPRRAYEIAELAPGLDVLVGSDDTVLEVVLAGVSAGSRATRRCFPAPACSSSRRASRETSPRPCRSTAPCTRCSAGTAAPSSSRPSSWARTWSGGPEACAGRRGSPSTRSCSRS